MLDHLFEKNRIWARGRLEQDPDYFRNLAAIQRPEYLWIGCSDSRVPANVITGLEPGQVFVHRNVANLVHPSDLNLLSVLEFAIETLKIEHIIVCGHHGCGGIRGAVDGETHGIIDHWLQPIRDVASSVFECADCIVTDDEQLNYLCEASVIDQVAKLARTPIIRKAWDCGMELRIHGWVYSLRDGILADLDCSQGPVSQSTDRQAPDN